MKTLKDIKRITECHRCGEINMFDHVSRDDLKQEAIKHAKNRYKSALNEFKENENSTFFKQLCAVVEDFCEFFNITEEELK